MEVQEGSDAYGFTCCGGPQGLKEGGIEGSPWYLLGVRASCGWKGLSLLVDRRVCRSLRPGARLAVSDSYLVDPASSHMLVSKIKPCMSKYKHLYCETANGSLNQLSFI